MIKSPFLTKGGGLKTATCEKWELISSHTARRSAATNMYLTGRMKTLEIMKLTGHHSEQNFFRYIRLTNDDTARSISGDMFLENNNRASSRYWGTLNIQIK